MKKFIQDNYLIVQYACEKQFSTNLELKYHCKIHTGEKSFECNACGKKFIFKGDLRKHEKTHGQQKTFKCGTCEKTFKQQSSLKNHENSHLAIVT